MNLDGATSRTSGRAGAGGVRRYLGWTGFSLNLGVADNMTAELWGILKGLELAWDPGQKRIILETDSKAALQLIQGAGNESPHYNLVSQIRNLTNRSWNCRLQHAWREGNKYADWLAKKSVSEEPGMQIISEPAGELRELLGAYILGVATPRFVLV